MYFSRPEKMLFHSRYFLVFLLEIDLAVFGRYFCLINIISFLSCVDLEVFHGKKQS